MRIAVLGALVCTLSLSPAFVRAQPVQAISRTDPGLISDTGGGSSFAESHVASTSADGRFVVFGSLSANLVVGTDENLGGDIFLRDRLLGTTTLVSHAVGAPQTAANGGSHYQTISADGAWVAFASFATDLVAGSDTNDADDVFLSERATGQVRLASHVPGAAGTTGNRVSISPVLSGDGAQLAFQSQATNLVNGTDGNSGNDVFLYDRVSGVVTLAS